MAVATTFKGCIFTVASLDQDWNYITDFPSYVNGIRVQSISFIPSHANDVCILKNDGVSGADMFYCASLNNFETQYYRGAVLKPYYDVSDRNSCNASANAKIIIRLGGYSD